MASGDSVISAEAGANGGVQNERSSRGLCGVAEIQNDKGDVVVAAAACGVAGPARDFVEEGGGKALHWEIDVGLQKVLEAGLAKFLECGVGGFKRAVRIEEASVLETHREFNGAVSRFAKKAEHQAVFFDLADSRRRARGKHQRRVTGARVAHHVLLQVNENIGRSYEVLFELAAEGAIHSGKDAGGIGGVRELLGEGNF